MENNDEFDREVEDILNNGSKKPKKKKINSGDKGHRGEREVCEMLRERFNGQPFDRVMGSGNRWSQVKSMPEHAKSSLLGDITGPDGFSWVLEVKNGYETDVDFYSLFKDGNRRIDEFISQSEDESKRANKNPMILYKRSRRPWLAMVPTELLKGNYDFSLKYRHWTIVAFLDLLKQPDEYFFK